MCQRWPSSSLVVHLEIGHRGAAAPGPSSPGACRGRSGLRRTGARTLRVTAADRPSSIVKRSRDQSTEAPSRRIWLVMVPPDSSFHFHTRSTNSSRPRSCRDLAFGVELALDDHLRGDAGVVGAGLPQRVIAAHAVVARQRVHERVLERVAHVQRAGDVRRRQHDAVRLALARWLERAAGFPALRTTSTRSGRVRNSFPSDTLGGARSGARGLERAGPAIVRARARWPKRSPFTLAGQRRSGLQQLDPEAPHQQRKQPEHTSVITTHASSVGQKPIRGSKTGKARNIGSVGTTYQNVYQAWLAIFTCGWRSTCSQINASTVTSGSAAIRPPRRSLRLATSETSTTTAAVIRYLVTSHAIGVFP